MGAKNSKFKWNQLGASLGNLTEGGRVILLFRKTPYPDPCVLINGNLVVLATENAQKVEDGLYAVGYGACTHCLKPKIYKWGGKSWIPSSYDSLNDLLNELDKISLESGFEYIYSMIGDDDLNIKSLNGVYQREGNTLKKLPGCKPDSNNLLMTQDNRNWIAAIVLVLIVIFIFLVIFYGK